jgi:bifunctional DNA-binding transcriptional regulator/antitoxin component of YhaV-PrlF toxin-antitoxin module
MAKKSDVNLVWPPRYSRNDPRNQARVKAGHLLSMQLGGYNYPIRKLRRARDVCHLTLPPQVREFLDVKRGDWLAFGEGPWPGSAWISRMTEEQYQRFIAERPKDFPREPRIVQGRRRGVWVTISPAFRTRLSIEPGDFVIFGIQPEQKLVNICAIKGIGDSYGGRRAG